MPTDHIYSVEYIDDRCDDYQLANFRMDKFKCFTWCGFLFSHLGDMRTENTSDRLEASEAKNSNSELSMPESGEVSSIWCLRKNNDDGY